MIERRDVKRHLTGKVATKDADVRQSLIRRFAATPGGKGTKKNPDWFYEFSGDVWQAYALGVTWLDRKGEKHEEVDHRLAADDPGGIGKR